MVPTFNFNENSDAECNFSDTKLCIPKGKTLNSLCIYPDTFYDCMGCVDYSHVDNHLCKCMDKYVGIGYIECEKEINGKIK